MAREQTRDVTYEHKCLLCDGEGTLIRCDWIARLRAVFGLATYADCHECDGTGEAETEMVMHFTPYGPEPDVGLFGTQIEDDYYTLDGSKPLPDKLQAQIDADKAWQERQIEAAGEECDDDYPEPDYEPDYD